MKIQNSKWHLNQYCPVCEQGNSLIFLTCPICKKIILACDEEGTVFPEPNDLKLKGSWPCDVWYSTFTKCPHCAVETDFKFSTGEEIQLAGFATDEYS